MHNVYIKIPQNCTVKIGQETFKHTTSKIGGTVISPSLNITSLEYYEVRTDFNSDNFTAIANKSITQINDLIARNSNEKNYKKEHLGFWGWIAENQWLSVVILLTFLLIARVIASVIIIIRTLNRPHQRSIQYF